MRAGGPPATRWGWHSLTPHAAQRVVADAGIRPGELVVDLGAGAGALTRALVDVGARVVAIELHPRRVALLRAEFAGDDVHVVRRDLRAFRAPRDAFRVVANPPWSLCEQLARTLLRAPTLVRADLVVPRWLAHRWAVSRRGVAVGRSIRAEAFTPRAPTGAAVAILLPHR